MKGKVIPVWRYCLSKKLKVTFPYCSMFQHLIPCVMPITSTSRKKTKTDEMENPYFSRALCMGMSPNTSMVSIFRPIQTLQPFPRFSVI